MNSRAFFSVVLFACFTGAASAETVKFKATKGYSTYTVREPVLTIRPGDILETNTLYTDYFAEKGGPWPDEVGPIFIEGATPDDTLVIKILKIHLNADTGSSATSTSYSALSPTKVTPMLNEPIPRKRFIWNIAPDRKTATLDLPASRMKTITVDLAPMLGRLATAPSGEQAVLGGVPYDFGGNMDTPETREGATVYLPIFHEGAYFYFGDIHAIQGHGEITGTGIETSADVTFEIDLIKGKTIDWPRIENNDFIMVAGSVRPLMDAFRIAHVEMVKWLESEYGFDRWEALQVLSQVGKAQVANVVDPNYTVVAMFPKKYLPK